MNKNNWRNSAGLSAVQMTYVVMLTVAIPTFIYLYKTYTYSGEYLVAQSFVYPQGYRPSEQCQGRIGRIADHEELHSEKNIRFNVTTPTNYRGDYAHPLLMVWAPSGLNEKLSERFTGLTGVATRQGYVVVHAASVPLGIKSLEELATIPGQVMKTWCIAADHVYYTGHSDGGTVSNALAVLPGRGTLPAVIAPSAMGMQGDDMAAYDCPAPTNVMLMHNQGDDHFPDYGVTVAEWWVQCNQCGEPRVSSSHPDCVEYANCAGGVRTLFCRADGNHAYWPGFHHDVMGFFRDNDSAEHDSVKHDGG